MMATSKEKTSNQRYFPVHFEGGLQSSVRAELIVELVKYILFERQQIPLSYDNLKKYSTHLAEQQQETAQRKPCWSSVQREQKKMIDVIDKLDQTINGVKNAFENCPEIKLAALALGPTSVSPKEVYKIELPPLNPEADNLHLKSCIKSLFRELVLSDPLGSAKQIHPTNAVLLLYAPRDSLQTWFSPKPSYKLPVRGRQFYINFVSSSGESNHDLTRELTFAELSGFELLENSVIDTSMGGECTNTPGRPASCQSSVSSNSDYVCIDSDIDCAMDSSVTSDSVVFGCNETDQNTSVKTLKKQGSASSILSQSSVTKARGSLTDSPSLDTSLSDCKETDPGNNYIWFQTPITIKGYRPRIFKL